LIAQLSPQDLQRWREDATRDAPVVVDVREPWEVAICRIGDSVAIPLGQLPSRIDDLPRERPIVLVCHHGGRSQHAAMLLARAGFESVHNLQGGVAAWAEQVDASMPRY
jgi:rhodanese-related sulfurtransferase